MSSDSLKKFKFTSIVVDVINFFKNLVTFVVDVMNFTFCC